LVKEALEYKAAHFQFFPIGQQSDKYLKLKKEDVDEFLALKQELINGEVFLHSSYWINLCSGRKATMLASAGLLRKELNLAKALNIKYLVLHAGAATGYKETPEDPFCRLAGIEQLASTLNNVLEGENDVKVLLENTAHDKKSIGGCFTDLALLQQKLKQANKIGFCLDTAHAFAFGHNLADTQAFIDLLDSTIGTPNIKLIHFNDSEEKWASKKDKHRLPGHGLIGKEILENLITHPKLQNIPKIIEPPELNKSVATRIISEVLTWRN
jgi:deoxyribonuclease-4